MHAQHTSQVSGGLSLTCAKRSLRSAAIVVLKSDAHTSLTSLGQWRNDKSRAVAQVLKPVLSLVLEHVKLNIKLFEIKFIIPSLFWSFQLARSNRLDNFRQIFKFKLHLDFPLEVSLLKNLLSYQSLQEISLEHVDRDQRYRILSDETINRLSEHLAQDLCFLDHSRFYIR